MSDLFQYDQMDSNDGAAAGQAQGSDEEAGSEETATNTDGAEEGAEGAKQDTQKPATEPADSGEPTDSGEPAGDSGEPAGDKSDDYPKWLDQASPENREVEDLRGMRNIDALIDDWKRLKQEHAQAASQAPEQYQFEQLENINKEIDTTLSQFGRQAGLSQESMSTLRKQLNEQLASSQAQRQQQRQQQFRDAEEKLRNVYPGAQYNEALRGIKAAVMGFAPEGMKDLLEEKELDNNPIMMQWLAEIGKAMGEDRLIGMGPQRNNETGAPTTFEYGEEFSSQFGS